ncbi:ABC transporter ATP-binding protein [bacterium]|nr:ABC transporter ATP-binding protein [bacterium]HPF35931.1 ABC transporter ATP-binding protein [Candidatus Krumholzibacteria bacterium]HRX51645.1 ABC transporter ATP-binding protein [Candidatus Krumholzibacteria bacterium]
MIPALEIRHLRLDLGGAPILRDVSLAVPAGSRLAVVGPNGAGKTSLLKCLCGIHRGWKGRISLDGVDIHGFGQRERARRIAYVPQPGGRLSPYTVRELIIMSRYPHLSHFGTQKMTDHELVRDLLARTGLGPLADRPLATLSGGERQKAHLAAALAQEAPVLLLDEPTTFLDPRHAFEIRSLLQRINREDGVTIVEVSHDLNTAVMDSDRVYALREGATAFFGPAERFLDEDVLGAIYGRSFLLADHPVTGRRVLVPEPVER